MKIMFRMFALTMIVYQSLDRIAEDGAEGVALRLDSLGKLVCEIVCDAADKRKREILMLVGSNIDTDEVDEALSHKILDSRIIEMVVDKL